MADELLVESDGPVATLWLNRPERMNALSFDLADQLRAALHDVDRDPDIRVVIITGKGKAFCSGDDVEAAWGDPRMEATVEELGGVRPPVTPEAVALLDVHKPLIAAVNGVAVGWGMDIALLCDVIIASERARFGQLFVKMGLMADVGGLWRLPQLVGRSKAAELLMTGDLIDAAEALRIGLVSSVVPGDELLPTARAVADRIAANPPLAVRYIKEGLRRSVGCDERGLPELGAFVGSGLNRLFQSEDHREAAAAFVEKRPAVFTGR